MKLYYMRGASSLAVHVTLEWTGLPYEVEKVDRGSIGSPGYLEINPNGTVPLLIHGDLRLTENVAILGYLADLHPDCMLLGDGTARSRADVIRWLAFLNSDVEAAFKPIFYPGRYHPDAAAIEVLATTARKRLRGYLELLSEQLAGREWLTGQRSIADAYFLVILRWAISTKVGLQGFSNLSGYVQRMHADAGVHAALVMEEGVSSRGRHAFGDSLQLTGTGDESLQAEVVGRVEYREGEGMLHEIPRGMVTIDVTAQDAVLAWADEKYRGHAAMPLANLRRYVASRDVEIRPAA